MTPRAIKVLAAAAIAIAIVIAVRHYFSPGEVVKRRLIATIEAFEEERMLAVMSGISRSYSDPWGFTYETLGAYFNESIETYEALDLDYVVAEPVVSGDEVRLGIEFVLWGRYEGTRGYVVGSISDPCTATLVWREETPGWRLSSTAQLDIPELRDELAARRKD